MSDELKASWFTLHQTLAYPSFTDKETDSETELQRCHGYEWISLGRTHRFTKMLSFSGRNKNLIKKSITPPTKRQVKSFSCAFWKQSVMGEKKKKITAEKKKSISLLRSTVILVNCNCMNAKHNPHCSSVTFSWDEYVFLKEPKEDQ